MKRSAAPLPLEVELQKAMVRWLDVSIVPGEMIYTHIPSGEKRDFKTGARLKAMGLRRGWPDFVFILRSGVVAFCEVKRPGGTLDPDQVVFRQYLASIGWSGGDEPPYACVRDVVELQDYLVRLGVPLRAKLMA